VKNKNFLRWLEAEAFDVAFTHMFSVCPIGIVHHAKIPAWIWLSSGQLLDFMANTIGLPSPPSYVPPVLMAASDEMVFFDRVKSFMGSVLMQILFPRLVPNRETAMFRRLIDPNFPDLLDLAKISPVVMVNAEEMLEPPRPLFHKVVYIGGIGMKKVNVKPLTEEYAAIAGRAEGMILFSFGSGANASHMPEDWKEAFMDAFRHFPKIEFLIRYDATDLNGKIPANVHLSKWLPQADLLRHPKMLAFISHGGLNSMQEATGAGVPLITIALFGDQPKNAMMAQKRGMSINIRKTDVSKATVTAAIEEILHNDKYRKAAKRLGEMIARKPIPVEQRLLEWTQFVGDFHHLENLVAQSTKLSFVQYHCLDVMAFLALSVFLLLFLVFLVLKSLARLIRRALCGGAKKKRE